MESDPTPIKQLAANIWKNIKWFCTAVYTKYKQVMLNMEVDTHIQSEEFIINRESWHFRFLT